MQKRNYYKTITESIVKAHHYTNLDSAMEDGHEMENMGKKIVAIITADPDQDLDWESEYEPFGATELTDEDEKECCEHEGIESDHELCQSCGYDVDCEDDENDDMEDIMIGGGFESSNDEFENADIKDILVDILHELRGDEEESDDDEIEISDENPMFGDSDDEESDDEESDDEDEDVDSMLAAQDDWSSEESDDEDEDDEEKEEEEEEEGDMDEILSIKEVENC